MAADADFTDVTEQPENPTPSAPQRDALRQPWWAPAGNARPARLVRQVPRRIGQTLLAATIISVFALSAIATPGRQPTIIDSNTIEAVPSLVDLAQGCGGVTSWPDAPAGENGWLEPGSEFTFPASHPPISGNFSKTPWAGPFTLSPSGEELPHPSEALNLLYRGWTVIWYREALDPAQIRLMTRWAESLPADAHLLVSPWPLEEQMPWRADRKIFITGWRTTQACLTFDAKVVKAFDQKRMQAPGAHLDADDLGPKAKVSTTDRIRATQEAQG